MAKYVTIKMAHKDALKAGLLICGDCGYPKNNHFDFGIRECAFAFCGGYKEVARYGKIVKRKK